MSTGRKTEKNGKTNSKGIVKRCTLIRRRREKHKKNGTFQKKGDQQFTDEIGEMIKQLLLENT